MIRACDIYRVFHFYYYYISPTSDHQSLDPRDVGRLLQSVFVHAKLLPSHLFATPWTVAQKLRLLCPWGFSRQEYWSGLLCPPPGNLPDSGIKPVSPALAGGFFTTSTTWEVQSASRMTIICLFSNTCFYVRGLTDTSEAQRGKVIVPGSHSKKMAKQIRCLLCSSESPAFSLCVQPEGQAHPTPSPGPAGHGQCSLGQLPSSFPTGKTTQGLSAAIPPVSAVGLGSSPNPSNSASVKWVNI